jgi:hypothetical protein
MLRNRSRVLLTAKLRAGNAATSRRCSFRALLEDTSAGLGRFLAVTLRPQDGRGLASISRHPRPSRPYLAADEMLRHAEAPMGISPELWLRGGVVGG